MPVLVDGDFNGAPRKLLLQASRNGYFFVLDRTNGKNLLTTPFAAVNWAKGIDERGPADSRIRRRSRRATASWSRRTKAAAPTIGRRASIPQTGLFIVSAQRRLRHLLLQAGARRRTAGRAPTTACTAEGVLRAIDYQTGKIRWNHDLGDGASAPAC